MRISLKANKILLNIQCGANLTLLGFNKRIPIVDALTNKYEYILCQNVANIIISVLQGSKLEYIVVVMQESNEK